MSTMESNISVWEMMENGIREVILQEGGAAVDLEGVGILLEGLTGLGALRHLWQDFQHVLEAPLAKVIPGFFETDFWASLQSFSPVVNVVVFALFPILLVFSLYSTVVFWATDNIRRTETQLQKKMIELHQKADQITAGIAALAQIYIDNPPGPLYRHYPRESRILDPE